MDSQPENEKERIRPSQVIEKNMEKATEIQTDAVASDDKDSSSKEKKPDSGKRSVVGIEAAKNEAPVREDSKRFKSKTPVQKPLHAEKETTASWMSDSLFPDEDVALQYALAMSMESEIELRESSLNQGTQTSPLSGNQSQKPAKWETTLGGSVPQKIIPDDVFAHLPLPPIDLIGHLSPVEFSLGPDEVESQTVKPQTSKEEASTETKACQTSGFANRNVPEDGPPRGGLFEGFATAEMNVPQREVTIKPVKRDEEYYKILDFWLGEGSLAPRMQKFKDSTTDPKKKSQDDFGSSGMSGQTTEENAKQKSQEENAKQKSQEEDAKQKSQEEDAKQKSQEETSSPSGTSGQNIKEDAKQEENPDPESGN